MLLKLISALAPAGFDNHVVCLIERGPLAEEIEMLGTPVTSLGMRSKFAPVAMMRLISIVRRFEPDIIHTRLYHADLAGLIAAAATSRLTRLIWNLQCSDMNFRTEANASTALLVRLLARLSGAPAGIIVDSHAGRLHHEVLGYRPSWWAEIPSGFDLERWQPDPAAGAQLRARLGLPDDSLIVGLCARMAPMKDHANFLTALAQIRDRLPTVYSVIAGRGTEMLAQTVDELHLEGRVSLLGERDDLPALLPGFDAFCLSSAFGEGSPNVIGEAMACGVPCVVTDVGESAEMVGDTGRIVPPRQPESLAAALSELLAMNGAARRELGARARLRVATRYSISSVAHRYMDIYAAVAGSRRDEQLPPSA
jgi:glycosyltransferase involved in cell wall biosynthesis